MAEAFRHALRRNEAFSRHLRATEKGRTYSVLGAANYRALRKRLVRSLNVDLGLLYAASLLAESRSLSTGRVLPGISEGWRSRPSFYWRAIRAVGRLYALHHKSDRVVYNLIVNEPYLDKLRAHASGMF